MSEPDRDPIEVAEAFAQETRTVADRLMDAVLQRDRDALQGAVLAMDREMVLALDSMLLPLQHLLSRRLHVIVDELAAYEREVERREASDG